MNLPQHSSASRLHYNSHVRHALILPCRWAWNFPSAPDKHSSDRQNYSGNRNKSKSCKLMQEKLNMMMQLFKFWIVFQGKIQLLKRNLLLYCKLGSRSSPKSCSSQLRSRASQKKQSNRTNVPDDDLIPIISVSGNRTLLSVNLSRDDQSMDGSHLY